jgi:pSer/pThr/pTyr-binding forkhead associated (FHA) protein
MCYTDTGSTNGSLLNGKAVKANMKNRLKGGDEIRLGEVVYTHTLPLAHATHRDSIHTIICLA